MRENFSYTAEIKTSKVMAGRRAATEVWPVLQEDPSYLD
jgi:hypothetical protein